MYHVSAQGVDERMINVSTEVVCLQRCLIVSVSPFPVYSSGID